jgi:hypothetical protein
MVEHKITIEGEFALIAPDLQNNVKEALDISELPQLCFRASSGGGATKD